MDSPSAMMQVGDSFGIALFVLQIPLGPFCVAIGTLVVDLFQNYCDFQNSFSQFLARGAFAVYLLHYFILNLYTWLFVLLLRNTQRISIDFTDGLISSTQIGGANCFCGVLFVFVCSVVTAFTIAGILK